MARYSVSQQGRTFIRGKSIGGILRDSIINDIVADGGDPASGYFGGQYKEIADRRPQENLAETLKIMKECSHVRLLFWSTT